MGNFIVSARKYRPDTFESVVGQKSITTTLKNAIANNHLAHAYLFTGPRGVGKTTCARIFAKTINCLNINDKGEACNECESCVSFGESRSFNIHELDAASNNSVDDIRNLTEQVRIPPQIGKYSVYIIDEVHMLSSAAFNAFLKTLEEPPEHAIFILATTEKHKIIPTILSRCQIFDFNRITVEDAVEHLLYVSKSEGVEVDLDGLNVIAQKADGAMRDALSFFDQIVSFSGSKISYKDVITNLNVLDYDYYFKLVDAFLSENISQAFLIFDDILEHGFDGHHFITGLSSHFRDLLVCKDEVTLSLLEVGATIRKRYREQALKTSVQFLFSALKISNQCDLAYKMSRNQRLHVELALMQIARLNHQPAVEISHSVAPAKPQKAVEQKPLQQKATTAEVAPVKKSTSSFSIKNVKKATIIPKKEEKEARAETTETSKTTSYSTDNQLDTESLKIAWLAFSETIDSPRMKSIFSNRLPALKGNNSLELALSSQQQVAFKDILPKLRHFLRERLGNSQIELQIVTGNEQQNRRPYTKDDKYKYLLEKNPDLGKLREKFKLI